MVSPPKSSLTSKNYNTSPKINNSLVFILNFKN